MVVKATERTTRAVEKRMVFKEKERLEGLKSERSSGREILAKEWDAREAGLYISIQRKHLPLTGCVSSFPRSKQNVIVCLKGPTVIPGRIAGCPSHCVDRTGDCGGQWVECHLPYVSTPARSVLSAHR